MNKLFVVVLFVFSGIIQAQNLSDDCFNSVNVSVNGLFTSNVSDAGTIVNKITRFGNRDENSVWLKINVIQSGTLGFDIIPKNQKVGLSYNFWVYGPNNDCSNLGKPIRSCIPRLKDGNQSTNRIGMNGNTTVTQTDRVIGNGSVRWLDVTKGEFYYIRIDKPTKDADFDLQWIGSAVNIDNATDSRKAFAFAPPPVGIIDLEATINSNVTTICSGDAVTITITGTPNATVLYHINGGAEQTAILDASGTFSFSESLTTTTVYTLTAIKIYDSIGVLLQEEALNEAVTVTVGSLPTASISGTATICSGETTPITFSGTPSTTVTYTVNGGADQQVVLDASGTAMIPVTLAGTYALVRATTPGTPGCSKELSGSATITIVPSPTVTITGTATICMGETATVTLTGTPDSTVTYTFNGGSEQQLVLDASGTATLSTTTAGTYALVRVTSAGALVCTRNLTDSATITVKPLPTVIIGGTTRICTGESANVTFIGTPDSTVYYTINEGAEQQLVLNAFGTGTVSATTTGIYTLVRVTSSETPACSQALSDSATITVIPPPTATITSTETICSGESATITFTGTPLATVTYTVNGGLNQQVALDASGTAILSTTTAGTYALVRAITSGSPVCSQDLVGSTTITIAPLPTATIAGTATICSGETATVTFTGTPNSTVTYTIDGGSEQEVVLNASGTGTVSATTAGTYTLVRVTTSGTPGCSQNLTGSATITVKPLPTATITSTETICSGETATITFTGTPLATVAYTVDGGSEQQVVLNASGTGTISTTTAGTYALVRITTSDTPVCSQNLTGSTTITIKPLPTAIIAGTATICSGETATVTFTGTPNSTVTYTIDGGSNQQIVLDALGAGTISTTTAGTYTLVQVTGSGLPACSQNLTGSATITVKPLPTATISGTATICSGETATITFTGTPLATVTYTIDGGSEQQVVLDASGAGTISTTTAGTYGLVRVTSSGTPVCSQAVSDSVTITVIPPPTATITSTTGAICSGEPAIITFTGTPLATVTYTVNGGLNQQVVLDASGTGTISTTTAGTYTLVRAITSGTPICSQDLIGSTTIMTGSLPTATIAGTATICSGETATVTFTGTSNGTVTYTINGGSEQQIILNALGTGTVSTTTTGTYTLVRVTSSGISACSQNLTGSVTITVIPPPTATITSAETICLGESGIITFTGTPLAAVTFTIDGGSEQQVVLNASGTGTISTTTAGTYALVRIATSGIPVCSQNLTGSTTITITPLPTATISGTTTICSGETASVTFTGTPLATVTYTINGGSEQQIILNASGTGTVSGTTTGTYALVRGTTPGASACSQNLSGSATITVIPPPTATISGTTTVCSGETTVITFTGTPLATVAYTIDGGSEQQIILNASGTGTISTTTAGTYALVRATTSGIPACSQNLTGSATITIKPLPTATISGTTTVCSGQAAVITFTGTPLATVMYSKNDLSTNEFITLDAMGTATITSPEVTTTVTYRLINIISAGLPACSQSITGSHSINIIPVPEIPVLPPYRVCDNDASGHAVFDLTIKENEIKAGNTELSVTFHVSEIDADLEKNALPMSYISGSTTIYVRVKNTTTGCYSVAPMNLETGEGSVLIMPVTPVVSCDGSDGNGIGSFDLNALIPGMVNGQTNIDVSFHETQENAQNGLFPITTRPYRNSIPWNQTLWVLASNTVTGCQKVYSFRLSVEREPMLPTVLDLDECDTDSNPYDNQTTFDLTVNTAAILAAQTDSSIAYQVKYYNSKSNAEADIPILSDGNVIGTNGQTIWVRVKSKIAGCYTIGSFKLIIRKPLLLIHPDDIIHCGLTQSNNEQQLFDLTIRENQITGGATGYIFNYYTNTTLPPDATTLINTPTAFLNTDTPQTLLVEVISEKGCKSYETITIIVEPLERPILNAGFVCIDSATGSTLSTHTINSGLDAATYTFQWYKDAIGGVPQSIAGATGMTYEVNQPGVYSVIATNIISGCVSLPAEVTIEKSEPAKVRAYASKAFSDEQSITVEAIGIGEYVYQLDDESIQSNPVFTNVSSGLHWITVYDNNGCSVVKIPIRIINYPHYFTPNGDGYHDFWNIGDLVNDPNAKIYIFDRYGKLLKQIKPSKSSGWNGMLNGRPLPATDYWFTVTYTEDGMIKEFKSHFSLKR
ncbi:T9SS type B sorting domain-containing protein [Flavobacterium sp. CAU 1735]|uniref:T9SS type B sorting domain-containing protein n=1 Tax=Flavobacterium sp. CAU 1735 TaxID=3140361 RepID=UPI0032613AF3